jgi:DUF1016 N-terminal domain
MAATYWLVGLRVVEHEQGGQARAGYGEELLARLSADLTVQFGRGFPAQPRDNASFLRGVSAGGDFRDGVSEILGHGRARRRNGGRVRRGRHSVSEGDRRAAMSATRQRKNRTALRLSKARLAEMNRGSDRSSSTSLTWKNSLLALTRFTAIQTVMTAVWSLVFAILPFVACRSRNPGHAASGSARDARRP